MSTNAEKAAARDDVQRLSDAARDHLWMHFTRHSPYENGAKVPVITKGEGVHIWDAEGRRYIDGLGGLFVVQAGHGRRDIAEAATRQASELAYFPLWSYAHPAAIELAERLSTYTPGDLNRVFFTNSGSEAVETAWKLAKQYFALTGRPEKRKVISRSVAYHGTTQGALSITGVPDLKKVFEPLVPGTFKVANTNLYRADEITGVPGMSEDPEAFGRWAAHQVELAILAEGPETVAAVFLEPVQNSGGCFPPPPGYFAAVREICDRHDVLLVSDEVICAFGRVGEMFACTRYGYTPDIITCAKGMTSGYAPIGAAIASDRIFEPFRQGDNTFYHGYTFGGHPVSSAVALANLDVFEREGLTEHVRKNEAAFRSTLEKLKDLPIVGDVRGDGYFYGIELVKDRATKQTFNAEEAERILRGFVSGALFDAGLYCRADDRGDPVVQLSPPLTADQAVFDEIEQILRSVLTEASTLI
ncbi:aspartate aminotransferase family protein [Nocardiopsis composta]|uniref:Adenosylmethionine-8-amino-7-oxononanoate aminotransferase n=1 Tax=Nocardiopsis composta TaxID=157465 RepID=A0A7W8QT88_9ACTN|nr:aspartate aminotransferase family protein [Nocardiopsis composta]MBB5436036.1 adenosylmethionine-8-amino-7-oxononanoate aminotransferase [Nocardiopsis composta]